MKRKNEELNITQSKRQRLLLNEFTNDNIRLLLNIISVFNINEYELSSFISKYYWDNNSNLINDIMSVYTHRNNVKIILNQINWIYNRNKGKNRKYYFNNLLFKLEQNYVGIINQKHGITGKYTNDGNMVIKMNEKILFEQNINTQKAFKECLINFFDDNIQLCGGCNIDYDTAINHPRIELKKKMIINKDKKKIFSTECNIMLCNNSNHKWKSIMCKNCSLTNNNLRNMINRENPITQGKPYNVKTPINKMTNMELKHKIQDLKDEKEEQRKCIQTNKHILKQYKELIKIDTEGDENSTWLLFWNYIISNFELLDELYSNDDSNLLFIFDQIKYMVRQHQVK